MWLAHVTVAAVIENPQGQFLLVEEHIDQQALFNQPAGHWEANESLVEAIKREVLEETARDFSPSHIVGIYDYTSANNDTTYLRIAFAGSVSEQMAGRAFDSPIVATHWLDVPQIAARTLRSPLVQRCIADYKAGIRYPLGLLQHVG